MTPEQKQWIDNASYEQLLLRWRCAPIGSPWFQGETGAYFHKVMRERRAEVDDQTHTATSKKIGWD